MGFISFLGRVLFSSIFILSAWQMFNEFGLDGGPAAKDLVPNVIAVKKYLSSNVGLHNIDVDARHLVSTSIALKGIGGILFVFGNSFGACLLLLHLAFSAPVLYDFYNYSPGTTKFYALLNEFLQSVALCGALLYFIGMKNSIRRRQPKVKTPKSKTV